MFGQVTLKTRQQEIYSVSEISRGAAVRTATSSRSDIRSHAPTYVLAGTGRSTICFGPSGVGKWSVRSYA